MTKKRNPPESTLLYESRMKIRDECPCEGVERVKKKIAGAPFEEWGSDFVLDALGDGRTFKSVCWG